MFSKQVRPQKDKQNISSTIVFYLFIFQLKFCNNVINDSLQPNPDSAADQAGADELDDGAEGSSVDKQVVFSKQRRGSTHNNLLRTHDDRLGTDLFCLGHFIAKTRQTNELYSSPVLWKSSNCADKNHL